MTDNITLPRKHIDYAAHALEHFNKDAPDPLVSEIIHHLRTALAAEQPKPEPVAWFLPQPLEVHYYSAKNQALQREIEALRPDAERWRWHRADIAKHMGRSPESIDAAIDAAMGDKR